jgi:predicted RNase H-like HicB family nuclease
MRSFTLVLEPDEDEGGYTVTVPALPGCVTQGDSLDEALTMAKDAIEGYLASLEAHGEPIPVDPLGEALECETLSRRFVEQEDAGLRQDDERHRRLELIVLHVA